MPIDLLPVSFKNRETLISLRHALPFHFNDLHILLIHPDSSLKETLTHFFGDDLRRDIKHVGVQFVQPLCAHIIKIVLTNFCRFEGERLDAAKILEVFLCDSKLRECRLWKICDLLEPLVVIVEDELRGPMVLAGDLPTHTYRLNGRVPCE